MTLNQYRAQWSYPPLNEVLAGMVGTFALIPEVIAFSYVSGVSPAISLYASFIISVAIALTGGRPGMISGAAGSIAFVVGALVHHHGVQYMFAATMLAGLLQLAFGLLRLHVVMRFVSEEVRTGFVNALAILIFSAQVPQMLHVTWHTYALIALGLAIIYLVPRVFSAIPSPLICIVVLTTVTVLHPMPVRTIADLGALPTGLPGLTWPHVPFNLDTLEIIFPYAVAMAAVGLLESLMTAGVVDEHTDTHGNPRMECTGLGISNIFVALFGGIAGCGMVGQTVGNLRYGGQGRLSTFTAGAFLLILIDILHNWFARVPLAALIAIMIMVSISTFAWGSLRDVMRHPKLSSIIMIVTVLVTVGTQDLAAGVVAGVLLSGVFFAWRATDMLRIEQLHENDADVYRVRGHLFFASAGALFDAINFQTTSPRVVIDVSKATFWDITSITRLEKIVGKLRLRERDVVVEGLKADKHRLIAEQSDNPLLTLHESPR